MKAVYLKEPKNVYMQEIEKPTCKPGYALIKIRSMGICGSDIGAFRGTNGLVSYPRIIGHELAGEIIEIEDNPNFKVGDRIVVDPYLSCGHCYPCSLGRTNCCEDLKVLGVQTDGGMQEYFLHPISHLVHLPDCISWEIAPISEPLTIALHALHRGGLKAGMHIAINGAGGIGILAALSAIAYDAEPILIDLVEERLAYARSLGVKHTINLKNEDVLARVKEITNGRMAEVVVEASGANSAIRNALDMVSYAGTIVLTGWPKSETSLPTEMITKKEIDIRGSRTSVREFEESLELIASGRVNAAAILSKTIALEEVPQYVNELSDHPERYLKINAVING